jgi:hypothetical protein
MGISSTVLPEVLQVLDNTKTWVPIGTIDPNAHFFFPANASVIYPTHAALIAGVTQNVGPTIEQQGFSVPGQGAARYDWIAGSTATADGVFVIQPTNISGAGRYVMRLVPAGMALSASGAIPLPTGTPTDAGPALTAMVNFINGAPVPIIVDGRYGLNNWTSGVVFDLESTNNQRTLQNVAPPPCVSGFVNIGGPTATLISANGKTAAVRGQCIEMATAPGIQTAGTTILFTSPTTLNMSGARVEQNAIYYPFNGIEMEASSGYQNITPFIRDNSIIEPNGAGIAVGLTSTGASGGNGVVVTGNNVNCNGNYGDGGAVGNSKSVGMWFASAAPYTDHNDMYRCTVGTKVVSIIPNQLVSGTFKGWLGDTSIQHDLMIGVEATATNSTVTKTNFDAWYVGATIYPSTDQPILMYNKGTSGSVKAITFSGGMLHQQSASALDFWLIQDDVNQLNIAGNYIFNDGAATGTALHINSTTSSGLLNINVTGNTLSGNPWGTGVSVTGTSDWFQIVDNNLSTATVPISWPTRNNALSRAVIKNNMGGTGLFEYNGPVLSLTGDSNNTYALTYGDNTTGMITITAGATPGNQGSVKLNMNRNATNGWTCNAVIGTSSGPNYWDHNAAVHVTPSTNGATLFWFNNNVNLTTGQTYQLIYSGCASQ